MGDEWPFPRQHAHHTLDFPPEVIELFSYIFGEHSHPRDIIRNQETIQQSIHSRSFNDGFGHFGSGSASEDEDFARVLQQIQTNFGHFDSGSALEDVDFARVLQEIQTNFEDMSVVGSNGIRNIAVNDYHGGDFMGVGIQNHIDSDILTYEELQNLEEESGSVSKGLSEELLSKLPSHKYKRGSSSRRSHQSTECAICKLDYQVDDIVTTLPCAHKYHQHCIKAWLKDNNTCCICKEEVAIG